MRRFSNNLTLLNILETKQHYYNILCFCLSALLINFFSVAQIFCLFSMWILTMIFLFFCTIYCLSIFFFFFVTTDSVLNNCIFEDILHVSRNILRCLLTAIYFGESVGHRVCSALLTN